jgi:hypothetical protein
MARSHPEAVELDEETRERMRELRRIANFAYHEMAQITMSTLGAHDEAKKIKSSGLDELHVVFHNQKDIFIRGGRCVGVYEDPPGVCRPCVDGG